MGFGDIQPPPGQAWDCSFVETAMIQVHLQDATSAGSMFFDKVETVETWQFPKPRCFAG